MDFPLICPCPWYIPSLVVVSSIMRLVGGLLVIVVAFGISAAIWFEHRPFQSVLPFFPSPCPPLPAANHYLRDHLGRIALGTPMSL
jgi:hypothetical protein